MKRLLKACMLCLFLLFCLGGSAAGQTVESTFNSLSLVNDGNNSKGIMYTPKCIPLNEYQSECHLTIQFNPKLNITVTDVDMTARFVTKEGTPLIKNYGVNVMIEKEWYTISNTVLPAGTNTLIDWWAIVEGEYWKIDAIPSLLTYEFSQFAEWDYYKSMIGAENVTVPENVNYWNYGQTFTPSTGDYTLTTVSFYLFDNGAQTGNRGVEIWSTAAGIPNSQLSIFSDITPSMIGTAYSWVNSTGSIALTNGTKYAIMVMGLGEAANEVWWEADPNGNYTGGRRVGCNSVNATCITAGGVDSDFSFITWSTDSPIIPSDPILNAPSNGTWGAINTELNWSNSTVGGGLDNSYYLEIANDYGFTSIVNAPVLPELNDGGNTSYQPNFTIHQEYYWRVLAFNTNGNSSWSSIRSINFDTMPTMIPNITHNQDSINLTTNKTIMITCDYTDPDGDAVDYYFYNSTEDGSYSLSQSNGTNTYWHIMAEGMNYFYCTANDSIIFTNASDKFSVTYSQTGITEDSAQYAANILEDEPISINDTFWFNPSLSTSENSSLAYDNVWHSPSVMTQTNYSATNASLLAQFLFTSPFSIAPNETYLSEFNFTRQVELADGSHAINVSTTQTQEAYKIYMVLCDYETAYNSTQEGAINFTFGYENNASLWAAESADNESTTDFGGTLTLFNTNLGNNRTYTYNLLEINNLSICLSPPWADARLYSEIIYEQTGYAQREYYHNNDPITNTTEMITLFLIGTEYSSPITVKITDELDNELIEAYINVYRYYPELDTFYLVTMGRTGIDGEDLIYLRKNDAFYTYSVEYAGENIISISTKSKIISDTVTLKKSSGTWTEYNEKYDLTDGWLRFANNNTFTFTGTKPASLTEVCLRVVYESFNSSNTLVCDTCTKSTDISLTCNVNSCHECGSGSYVATVIGHGSGWGSILEILRAYIITDAVKSLQEKIGLDGVVSTMGLSLTMGMAGMVVTGFNPVGLIAGVDMGLIGSFMLDLIIIDSTTITALVSFLILSSIVIFLLARRRMTP